MKLNIGDRVKFLNDQGGGKITQLIDKDTVMVLSEVDDFEIPVLIRELIPLDKKEDSGSQSIAVESIANKSNCLKESSLAFVLSGKEYKSFIVNALESTLIFGVFIETSNGITGILSGMLQPRSSQEIGTYSLKDLDEVLNWKIQGFYFEKHPRNFSAPLNCAIKMQPKKLLQEGGRKFVEEIGEEGIVIPLKNTIDRPEPELTAVDLFADEPKNKGVRKQNKRKSTKELLEVDLHIHELLETTAGMSKGDMLEYQLDTFRKVLVENKNNKGRKIVFIHGVGNGVLKQCIRHELQKYPRYIVQDASFQEYGWGATMVVIK